jgi:hypothetical protein
MTGGFYFGFSILDFGLANYEKWGLDRAGPVGVKRA